MALPGEQLGLSGRIDLILIGNQCMRYIIIHTVFCFFCFVSFGQSKKSLVDTSKFELDSTLIQNKCKFYFWRGTKDTVRNLLCVERVYKNTHTIIFSDFVHDGDFEIRDVNDDGFADLIHFYHDYDIIHFFNPRTNKFSDNVISMPSETSKIDKNKNIYCGFHETMYGDKYSYSILYKYKDTIPYFFYKLVFVTTKGGYETMDSVKQIKLYKFLNGNYSKLLFIKNIETKNLKNFDYEFYWKKNYMRLLGSN